METTGYRGRSRRRKPRGKTREERKISHLRSVYFEGLDENQIIYYPWDIVKSVEAVQDADSLARLGKQLHSQTRVEI